MNTEIKNESPSVMPSIESKDPKACFHSQAYFPDKTIYEDASLVKYAGNHLPNWETQSVIYHVSYRLADSIPDYLIRQWNYERNRLLSIAYSESRKLSNEEVRRLQFLYSDKSKNTLMQVMGPAYCEKKLRQK